MSLQGSSIPHLARSILERSASPKIWRSVQVGLVKSSSVYVPLRAVSSRAPPRSRHLPARTSPREQPSDASNSSKPNGRLRENEPTEDDGPTRQKRKRAQDTEHAERKRYRVMMIATTSFATLSGAYVMMLYTGWNNEIRKHVLAGKEMSQNADVSDRWKQLGRDYDEEVEWSEKYWFLNIAGKRRKLAAQAYGKVLEVSAGTGRNIEFYNLHPFDPTKKRQNLISSLTINDQSPIMIATAEKKYEQFQTQNERPFAGTVDFVVGDAGIRGVIKRPEGGYDTIVQTMGLCSMVDPVGFLRAMGSLCRQPDEQSNTKDMQTNLDDGKGGRILLLEHGRSRYGIVNRILDSGASMHADHYGCWWNKDIAKIIQQSGLEVERIKRYHWGTTWEIHLRPRSTMSSQLT